MHSTTSSLKVGSQSFIGIVKMRIQKNYLLWMKQMQFTLTRKIKLHITNQTFIFNLVPPVSYIASFQHISELFSFIILHITLNICLYTVNIAHRKWNFSFTSTLFYFEIPNLVLTLYFKIWSVDTILFVVVNELQPWEFSMTSCHQPSFSY